MMVLFSWQVSEKDKIYENNILMRETRTNRRIGKGRKKMKLSRYIQLLSNNAKQRKQSKITHKRN